MVRPSEVSDGLIGRLPLIAYAAAPVDVFLGVDAQADFGRPFVVVGIGGIAQSQCLLAAVAAYCGGNHALARFVGALQEGNGGGACNTGAQVFVHIINAVVDVVDLSAVAVGLAGHLVELAAVDGISAGRCDAAGCHR